MTRYFLPRNLTLLQQTSPSSRSAQDEALDRLLSPTPLRASPNAVSARAPTLPEADQKDAPPQDAFQLSHANNPDFALRKGAKRDAAEVRGSRLHGIKVAAVSLVMGAILLFVWRQLPHETGLACLPNCAAQSLARMELAGFSMRGGNFTESDLQHSDLSDASLYQALFVRANLRDALLIKADLSQAILAYADLRGANLTNANLRHADLRDADLRNAILAGADLRGANLEGATLLRADLGNAVLTEANFDNANLRRTNLQYADLRRASLRFADLRRAELLGADFAGADLDDVILDDNQTITPLQTNAP